MTAAGELPAPPRAAAERRRRAPGRARGRCRVTDLRACWAFTAEKGWHLGLVEDRLVKAADDEARRVRTVIKEVSVPVEVESNSQAQRILDAAAAGDLGPLNRWIAKRQGYDLGGAA